MNKLGFKNFRRFIDFPALGLGDINILVGANNSGKSTFVKAAMLVMNFLKNAKAEGDRNVRHEIMPHFDFDLPRVNIANFHRAVNRDHQNEPIMIAYSVGNVSFVITVSKEVTDGNVRNAGEESFGYVRILQITDHSLGVSMTFNFSEMQIVAEFEHRELSEMAESRNGLLYEKRNYLNLLKKDLEEAKSKKDVLKITDLSSKIRLYEKELEGLNDESDLYSGKETTNIPLPVMGINRQLLILSVIDAIIFDYTVISKDKQPINRVTELETMRRHDKDIKAFKASIAEVLDYDYEFIPARGIGQDAILKIGENKDTNSETVHEFYKIRNEKSVIGFMKKWMQKKDGFGIGKSFLIQSVEGEAYKVFISNDDKIKFNRSTREVENASLLSDMGRGSAQLMLMLMRLAVIINKAGGFSNSKDLSIKPHIVVMIEEPEQNVHPNWQSKLADFFVGLQKYGLQFIIETHSEYLIRRTQSLVKKLGAADAEKLQEVNPFCVFYFPDSDNAYKMQYRTDGKFSNKFGSGFFDEAYNQTLEIL